MVPTIVLKDGRLFATLGARGGRRIIGTAAQVVSNLLDHGMSAQAAVSGPHTDSSEPSLRLDSRHPASMVADLEALGHRVVVSPGRGGAIVISPDGRRHAGEDPTGESIAMGY